MLKSDSLKIIIVVKVFIDKYKVHLEQSGKSVYTIQAYLKDVEQLFLFTNTQEIASVTEESIKKYTLNLKKANYDAKSVSRKINSIRSFFRFLKENGIINEDPASNIHHPKIKERPPRYLTKEEYNRLRKATDEDKRTYAMIELLLQTGMRIGELCRLKVSDIRYKSKNRPYMVFIDKYQSTQSRTIPLNTAAAEALVKYLEDKHENGKNVEKDSYIFATRTGKPVIVRNARTYICRIIKKAKIHNATVNDLRNTFIYHHLKNGANILQLSQIVGHKNLSSTIKYTKIKKTKNSPKNQMILKNL